MEDSKIVDEKIKELKKELYSKICVAGSIQFTIGTPDIIFIYKNDQLSYLLATIFARDRVIVAARLDDLPDGCKVYLSRNSSWALEYVAYIRQIEEYLKRISEVAPLKVKDADKVLFDAINTYCYTKIENEFDKFKKYINIVSAEGNYGYIKDFTDFTSINIKKMDKILGKKPYFLILNFV